MTFIGTEQHRYCVSIDQPQRVLQVSLRWQRQIKRNRKIAEPAFNLPLVWIQFISVFKHYPGHWTSAVMVIWKHFLITVLPELGDHRQRTRPGVDSPSGVHCFVRRLTGQWVKKHYNFCCTKYCAVADCFASYIKHWVALSLSLLHEFDIWNWRIAAFTCPLEHCRVLSEVWE